MEFKNNVLELIGNTPLVKINRLNRGLKPQIFAKMESMNPGGSIKDRIGISMIEEAEGRGALRPGGTIIEATSGNTGIGLALAAAVKGYKTIFVCTDKVSLEKINYLKALGSEVIVVSNAVRHDSADYYVNVARKIADETSNSIFMYQYSNPANPSVHYRTTGPELWRQTDGKITHFVTNIGTGGNISGTGKFLKEKNPAIKVIAADPVGSIFKDYKEKGITTEGMPYLVEGIGQDCIPQNVHFQYIDEIHTVTDKQSFQAARLLTREEGIFCGGSSGTNLYITLKIARDLDENALIVFMVSDTGERYLSKFYNESWLKEKRLLFSEVRTLGDISKSKKAGNLKNLIYIDVNDTVKNAIKLMNEKGFSQLPVMDNGQPVGSIREPKFMAAVLENPELIDSQVEKLMGESFPVLDSKTELPVVKDFLTHTTAVLVAEYGRIIDLITRYDLIEFTDNYS
ncbi:MAG: pyridoxal-phosphate dependent enzyme [Bacteroidota bacterium]|nr:pyridoxal-phosphate dependent enzyme [Bacteroidota bacterium]MDP4196324.1 pyridoxal-phosphate dependent enzyme [Bacteroidota bacterium]